MIHAISCGGKREATKIGRSAEFQLVRRKAPVWIMRAFPNSQQNTYTKWDIPPEMPRPFAERLMENGQPLFPYPANASFTRSARNGTVRKRTPVASNTALASAPGTGVEAASPTPIDG